MKLLSAFIFLSCVALGALGDDRRFQPAVVDPERLDTIFADATRCNEPQVLYAPGVVYPWEMHSGIAGAVDVCVKVDASGYPLRVAVLRSTQQVFERYAVANVIQTNWRIEPTDKRTLGGWFVRRIEFVRVEEPNHHLR